MANCGPLTAETVYQFGAHQQIRLVFFIAATSLTGGQPNFARCLAVSWAGTQCIHFPVTEFCLVQNSLYIPSLALSYTGSVMHGISTAGVN